MVKLLIRALRHLVIDQLYTLYSSSNFMATAVTTSMAASALNRSDKYRGAVVEVCALFPYARAGDDMSMAS